MGEINIPREERDALKAVDPDMLDKLIHKCLDERRLAPLQGFRLERCGPYVASCLRKFDSSLTTFGTAKAAKKLAETQARARRAGSDLAVAVQQMKRRVEVEEEEMQLFHIEDQILPPYRFSEHLAARVSFRWRQTMEANWILGSITFCHDVDLRPDYTLPLPKRKPSARKQEQERQGKLHREWEHLVSLGLHSLREYFRQGGNASGAPQVFQAKADPYTRGLNNFSARFWSVET